MRKRTKTNPDSGASGVTLLNQGKKATVKIHFGKPDLRSSKKNLSKLSSKTNNIDEKTIRNKKF